MALRYDCRACGAALGADWLRASQQADYCPEHAAARGHTSGRGLSGSEIPVGRGHPAHAQDMARRALKQGTLRYEVWRSLTREPGTDDDLEIRLGRSHQSVSGCRKKLVDDGWVVDTGQLKLNRYGNAATVWAGVST
jgi:hypothetical protein